MLLEAALLEAGFVASMAGFYMLCALLLESGSSATLMNLSLLTSDFWAVAVKIAAQLASPRSSPVLLPPHHFITSPSSPPLLLRSASGCCTLVR